MNVYKALFWIIIASYVCPIEISELDDHKTIRLLTMWSNTQVLYLSITKWICSLEGLENKAATTEIGS